MKELGSSSLHILGYLDLGYQASKLHLFLFGPTSLAMLDGLTKYRCADLNTDDGNYQNGTIELSWRPNSPEESSLNYHDRLQYWCSYVATTGIEETLSKINQLDRYDESSLRNMAGIMGSEDVLERELSSTGHFLAVLSNQRHYNIHGKGSSGVITPLALNLCNLLFLDMIGPEQYENLREQYLIEQRKQ